MFLKFMSCVEPELKAASCKTIGPVCKNMSDDEHKSKLQSSIKRLASEPIEYIKSNNFFIQSNWLEILFLFVVW